MIKKFLRICGATMLAALLYTPVSVFAIDSVLPIYVYSSAYQNTRLQVSGINAASCVQGEIHNCTLVNCWDWNPQLYTWKVQHIVYPPTYGSPDGYSVEACEFQYPSYDYWGWTQGRILTECPIAVPPYIYNSKTNMCERQANIVLQGLTTIEPGKSLTLQAHVVDSNNQSVAGAIVHLKVEALSHSGGHIHGDDNSALRHGKISGIGPEIVALSPTGADGIFSFTFNGPAVSGTYKFTAWCDNLTCTQQGTNTTDVKIDGLQSLPASANFFLEIGQTGRHPDNHYLTPAAIDKAQTLAYFYKDPFSSAPLLRYNDASLQWGGVLDLDGDWQAPHAEHRRGTVIDVRANRTSTAIPVSNYKMFEKVVTQKIGGSYLHESVGTSNEHFHVRLLNKAE